MSGIDLYLDFNGERVRISSARLRTQADADELIYAINIVRHLLPDGASEKAVAVPPAGEGTVASTSPAPITEAPTPLPDDDEVHRPAEAKTSDQEPSVSDGSGGAHDGLPVRPATQSTPDKSGEAPASPAPTRTGRIRALQAAHPEMTAPEASRQLGIAINHLRALSQNAGLRWAPAAKGRPARTKAPEPAPAPAAEPEPSPFANINTQVVRKPKGTRFYLRNDAGEYLHFSATCMTATKAYAWIGDENHLRNVRRKFEIARDLAEVVVPKEQAGVAA